MVYLKTENINRCFESSLRTEIQVGTKVDKVDDLKKNLEIEESNEINSKLQQFMPHVPLCFIFLSRINENLIKKVFEQLEDTGGESPKCVQCDFVGKNEQDLKYHIHSRHTTNSLSKRNTNGSFSCDLCERKCTALSNLKVHIKTAHNTDKAFKCSYCSYQTNHKEKLNAHLDNAHAENKIYQCCFCEHKFFNAGDLNEHSQKEHERITWEYETCDLEIAEPTIVNPGDELYFEENCYQCMYCVYNCNNLEDLITHIETAHAEEIERDAESIQDEVAHFAEAESQNNDAEFEESTSCNDKTEISERSIHTYGGIEEDVLY